MRYPPTHALTHPPTDPTTEALKVDRGGQGRGGGGGRRVNAQDETEKSNTHEIIYCTECKPNKFAFRRCDACNKVRCLWFILHIHHSFTLHSQDLCIQCCAKLHTGDLVQHVLVTMQDELVRTSEVPTHPRIDQPTHPPSQPTNYSPTQPTTLAHEGVPPLRYPPTLTSTHPPAHSLAHPPPKVLGLSVLQEVTMKEVEEEEAWRFSTTPLTTHMASSSP